MAQYIVNRNAQPNGDHEVHNLNGTCYRLPNPENRVALGEHYSCTSAVQAARRHYTQVNGCAYCASACHTG